MTDSLIDSLLNFSIVAAPGGIEQQEAQGQQNLVHSTALPIKGDWEVLERWGVVRSDKIDDLFCHCTLPDGWAKVATDHSMWSSLVDTRGLKRASIFYKAAFYDRDAHIDTVKRFSVATVYYNEDDPIYGKHYQIRDNALDRVVFVGDPVNAAEINGKLVAVKGKEVYVLERTSIHKGTVLSPKENLLVDNAVLLSREDFRQKWHNRNVQQYEFIEAIDELAAVGSKKYINQLPTDDSTWEPAFDFPEVDK